MTVTGQDRLTTRLLSGGTLHCMRQNPLTALFTLSTAIVCALLTLSSPAQAQPPTPTQPGQPPAQPATPPSIIPVPSFVPIGETYRFEVSVDAWSTLPSTMMFSDTETITTTAATSTTPAVTTTITGTNIDFSRSRKSGSVSFRSTTNNPRRCPQQSTSVVKHTSPVKPSVRRCTGTSGNSAMSTTS